MPLAGPIRRWFVVFLILLLPLATLAQIGPKATVSSVASSAAVHVNPLPSVVADFGHAFQEQCAPDCDHAADAPFGGDGYDTVRAQARVQPASVQRPLLPRAPLLPGAGPAYPPLTPPPLPATPL